jgi:hypothetical protein
MNINPFKTFRVLVTRYYESIRYDSLNLGLRHFYRTGDVCDEDSCLEFCEIVSSNQPLSSCIVRVSGGTGWGFDHFIVNFRNGNQLFILDGSADEYRIFNSYFNKGHLYQYRGNLENLDFLDNGHWESTKCMTLFVQ